MNSTHSYINHFEWRNDCFNMHFYIFLLSYDGSFHERRLRVVPFELRTFMIIYKYTFGLCIHMDFYATQLPHLCHNWPNDGKLYYDEMVVREFDRGVGFCRPKTRRNALQRRKPLPTGGMVERRFVSFRLFRIGRLPPCRILRKNSPQPMGLRGTHGFKRAWLNTFRPCRRRGPRARVRAWGCR